MTGRQRTVVVLRYCEDLSEAEVASLMGVRPGTVKSQASKAQAPGDVPDYWLTTPVELLEDVGGVMNYVATKDDGQAPSGFLNVMIGRADPAVSTVAVTMPTGTVMTVPVENGMWVARLVTPSAPGPDPSPASLFTGYGPDGAVVYRSPAPSVAVPFQPCWVTPSGQVVTGTGDGQPLTAAVAGHSCQAAVAWG